MRDFGSRYVGKAKLKHESPECKLSFFDSEEVHKELMKVASERQPVLKEVIRLNGILELPRHGSESFLRYMTKTTISQCLSATVARSIWGNIKNQVGAETDLAFIRFFADLAEDQHRKVSLSRRKLKTVKALAHSVENEDLDVRVDKCRSSDDVRKELTRIWGVGPWSADMCSIFYCGMQDVFPATDVAVNRAVRIVCGDAIDQGELFSNFKPFRSYLCLHMWQGLDSELI